ncbi:hypothetical protein [uncultured Hymenobacter sp.]|uniref:hypothetical protein n=1 Tax=uncultured Hymenobacter sp. TaxID=170016 RepID=UPI0035CBE338
MPSLGKVKEEATCRFKPAATACHGWFGNVLVQQLKGGYRRRQGQAVTNIVCTLSAANLKLPQQPPQAFLSSHFLALAADFKERPFTWGLLAHITTFLLELGNN